MCLICVVCYPCVVTNPTTHMGDSLSDHKQYTRGSSYMCFLHIKELKIAAASRICHGDHQLKLSNIKP